MITLEQIKSNQVPKGVSALSVTNFLDENGYVSLGWENNSNDRAITEAVRRVTTFDIVYSQFGWTIYVSHDGQMYYSVDSGD